MRRGVREAGEGCGRRGRLEGWSLHGVEYRVIDVPVRCTLDEETWHCNTGRDLMSLWRRWSLEVSAGLALSGWYYYLACLGTGFLGWMH